MEEPRPRWGFVCSWARGSGGSGSHAATGEGAYGETQTRRKPCPPQTPEEGEERAGQLGGVARRYRGRPCAGSRGRRVTPFGKRGERRPESRDGIAALEPGALRKAGPVDSTLPYLSVVHSSQPGSGTVGPAASCLHDLSQQKECRRVLLMETGLSKAYPWVGFEFDFFPASVAGTRRCGLPTPALATSGQLSFSSEVEP